MSAPQTTSQPPAQTPATAQATGSLPTQDVGKLFGTTLLGTTERRIAALAACAALAVGFVAFRSWLDARDDRTRMAATVSSQQTIIAAAEKREQDREAKLADTLKQIDELKRTVTTPQQVLRTIPQYLPPLPEPLEVLTAKSTPGPSGPARPSPSASGTSNESAAVGSAAKSSEQQSTAQDVRVPSADLKPLFDYVQDCRACEAKLTAVQQDLQDERTKSAALTKERDAAVKAAKGGSVWTRTVRAVKWIGVGFVVGFVVRSGAR